MAKMSVIVKPFDYANEAATPEELRAVYALVWGPGGLRTEEWPDDPPRSYDKWLTGLRTVPPFVALRIWVAWQGGEAVGRSTLEIYDTPDNRHLANADVGVLLGHRRQGIGKRLLVPAVQAAEASGRTLLMDGTDSAIPAGEAFMERLGARRGMVSRTNQLSLVDLDPALMKAWREQGPRKEFELGWWEGAYPEAEVDAICALRAVMNTAPRDDLEVEDQVWTPEIVHQQQESLEQRKVDRRTVFARHRSTGELAGYTEVFYDRALPHVLQQGDTGVLPKYRGHGLGKWLKGTMVERVPREWPEVKFIRTGNANSNAPMLRINHAMGFRSYKDWTIWQVEVTKVKEYLRTA